ncbi:MAG: flavodoxin/nitric oxide synthase [Variovorax sp.]|nr:flavodoxin/nitric oxide synthase [Variovorax sp.]
MSETLARALGAGAMLLGYIALCAAVFVRQRRRRSEARRAAQALAGDGTTRPALVLFASQTGQAESIAWDTARWLHGAGTPTRVLALDDVDASTLEGATRAFVIASTYGEGDAPDGAAVFAEKVMSLPLKLPALRYAVLALGDRGYDNFCGFGRALDKWLARTGARPMVARIDVHNGDPASLAQWRAHWHTDAADGAAGAGEAAASDKTIRQTGLFAPWRLASRALLNAGSAGAPVYQLALEPPHGLHADWCSGDLVQIQLAGDAGRLRDYSVASIATDGRVELLVRQEQHPDGSLGAASGLLTSTLSIGDTVAMRLRPHTRFWLEGNADRPLIFIGNGTGLAGLRSHLRARAAATERSSQDAGASDIHAAADNWLIFGERNAAYDFLCRAEIEAWQATGHLPRLDMVFSRDQPERLYVQHRLLQHADVLTEWMRRGAAIYVCGSLKGMASGVDSALRQILGDAELNALAREGRYRRDVY